MPASDTDRTPSGFRIGGRPVDPRRRSGVVPFISQIAVRPSAFCRGMWECPSPSKPGSDDRVVLSISLVAAWPLAFSRKISDRGPVKVKGALMMFDAAALGDEAVGHAT
jgi:hypothetical protein